jgi:alkaline phosphatase
MKQVEDVATQFGGKYADDLTAQAKAVNEIERLFGSFAETSFKGEITASGQRIAESPSLRQAGTEAVRLSAKQLRKMRQNETTQIRALEELIYQGGN